MNHFRRNGFLYVTGGFFLGSFALQWASHSGPTGEFWNAVMENWQSEFLQLVWQVLGLRLLYAVGSPQDRRGQEKTDIKLDAILLAIAEMRDPVNGANDMIPYIEQLDEDFR